MPIATQRFIGARRQTLSLWPSREAFYSDIGLFILGAAGAFSINIVGSLPGDELLLFPFLPVLLLTRGKRAFKREYMWFYFWAIAWLLGTFVADSYNGIPLNSRLKGVARVIFFVLDFAALAILVTNKTRRMIVFALTIVFVMLNIARYFRGSFLTQWKFGIASSVIIIGLLISSYFYGKRQYWLCFGISVLLAAANLVFAFRSQIGLVLISAMLVSPIFGAEDGASGSRNLRARKIFRVVAFLMIAAGSAYLTNQLIHYASSSGLFEEVTADKFDTQSQGKLGVLFGARPETLVAIQAIVDSPIIGHGSFKVDQHYLELKRDIQYEYGYVDNDTPEDIEDPGIPTHSHLTMAWVESGILGGMLWIYILTLTIRAILEMSYSRFTLAPLYCYLLTNFVWDILYSPFGSVNRMWGAYVILVAYKVLTSPKEIPVKDKTRRRSIGLPPLRQLIGRRGIVHWRPGVSR